MNMQQTKKLPWMLLLAFVWIPLTILLSKYIVDFSQSEIFLLGWSVLAVFKLIDSRIPLIQKDDSSEDEEDEEDDEPKPGFLVAGSGNGNVFCRDADAALLEVKIEVQAQALNKPVSDIDELGEDAIILDPHVLEGLSDFLKTSGPGDCFHLDDVVVVRLSW